MSYETVNYERKGKIAVITLNRPEVLNGISAQLDEDVMAAFDEFDTDEEAWVAVIHGAGRCFSAGADVKARQRLTPAARHKNMMLGPNPMGYLGHTVNWKPVIAAVHSYCLGGGFSIALECDLIVASEDAMFGISETKRGLSGARVWSKLHYAVPAKVSTELLLFGEPVSAAEFYRLGLINRLVPVGQHLQEAEDMAQRLAKVPPLAVRAGVRASRWPRMQKLAEANLYLQPLRLHLTEDFEESAVAFMQKREPVFRGR